MIRYMAIYISESKDNFWYSILISYYFYSSLYCGSSSTGTAFPSAQAVPLSIAVHFVSVPALVGVIQCPAVVDPAVAAADSVVTDVHASGAASPYTPIVVVADVAAVGFGADYSQVQSGEALSADVLQALNDTLTAVLAEAVELAVVIIRKYNNIIIIIMANNYKIYIAYFSR